MFVRLAVLMRGCAAAIEGIVSPGKGIDCGEVPAQSWDFFYTHLKEDRFFHWFESDNALAKMLVPGLLDLLQYCDKSHFPRTVSFVSQEIGRFMSEDRETDARRPLMVAMRWGMLDQIFLHTGGALNEALQLIQQGEGDIEPWRVESAIDVLNKLMNNPRCLPLFRKELSGQLGKYVTSFIATLRSNLGNRIKEMQENLNECMEKNKAEDSLVSEPENVMSFWGVPSAWVKVLPVWFDFSVRALMHIDQSGEEGHSHALSSLLDISGILTAELGQNVLNTATELLLCYEKSTNAGGNGKKKKSKKKQPEWWKQLSADVSAALEIYNKLTQSITAVTLFGRFSLLTFLDKACLMWWKWAHLAKSHFGDEDATSFVFKHQANVVKQLTQGAQKVPQYMVVGVYKNLLMMAPQEFPEDAMNEVTDIVFKKFEDTAPLREFLTQFREGDTPRNAAAPTIPEKALEILKERSKRYRTLATIMGVAPLNGLGGDVAGAGAGVVGTPRRLFEDPETNVDEEPGPGPEGSPPPLVPIGDEEDEWQDAAVGGDRESLVSAAAAAAPAGAAAVVDDDGWADVPMGDPEAEENMDVE